MSKDSVYVGTGKETGISKQGTRYKFYSQKKGIGKNCNFKACGRIKKILLKPENDKYDSKMILRSPVLRFAPTTKTRLQNQVDDTYCHNLGQPNSM